MRILVTGGAGFIGRAVVTGLTGDDVGVFDRAVDPRDDITDPPG